MFNWLCDPHELGRKPAEIQYVSSFVDPDGLNCHIFKYRKHILSRWLLGISGDAGSFSEMEPFRAGSAQQDAQKIMDLLKSYWKREAQKQALNPNR